MKLFLTCIFLIGVFFIVPQSATSQQSQSTSVDISKYFPASDANIFNNNSWDISILEGRDPFYDSGAIQARTQTYKSDYLEAEPVTEIEIGLFPDDQSANSALNQVLNFRTHQGFQTSPYNSSSANCDEAKAPSDIAYIDDIVCESANLVVHVSVNGNQYQTPPMAKAFMEAVLDNISSAPNQQQPNSQGHIPTWIKNNAKWWSQNQVEDADFTKGIQYLIQQGIITVSNTEPSSNPPQPIPQWVRNNAGWWADGQISDDDFLKGIQYLIQIGIIKV